MTRHFHTSATMMRNSASAVFRSGVVPMSPVGRQRQRFSLRPDTGGDRLLFGIQVDTNDFTREVADRRLRGRRLPRPARRRGDAPAGRDPSVSLGDAVGHRPRVTNRDQEGSCSDGVGEISDRDALAQAAVGSSTSKASRRDGVRRRRWDGIRLRSGTWGRDRPRRGAAGRLGPIGSAGGHADMAGAQIDVGRSPSTTARTHWRRSPRHRHQSVLDAVQTRSHRRLGASTAVPTTTWPRSRSRRRSRRDDTSATAEAHRRGW